MLAIKSTDVRSRVEPDLKEDATLVLAQCGLSLSDGIRLFLRQVVAKRGLPFEVKLPTDATKQALEELKTRKGEKFSSVDALFNDLEN